MCNTFFESVPFSIIMKILRNKQTAKALFVILNFVDEIIRLKMIKQICKTVTKFYLHLHVHNFMEE